MYGTVGRLYMHVACGFPTFLRKDFTHIENFISLLVVKRRTLSTFFFEMPTLRLGDIVPDFTTDTTDGEIRFHEWLEGSWAIFFR